MKLLWENRPDVRETVERLLGQGKRCDFTVADQPWNPHASHGPVYAGMPVPLKDDERAGVLAAAQAAWLTHDEVLVIIPCPAPVSMQLDNGIVGCYTVAFDERDNVFLFQSVVVQAADCNLLRRTNDVWYGQAFRLPRELVAAWDRGGRKEPQTRRSGEMPAVRA